MDNSPASDVVQHLETAHVFMEKARADKQGRKVLVRCEHGLNLSGAVVIAYMMHKLSLHWLQRAANWRASNY